MGFDYFTDIPYNGKGDQLKFDRQNRRMAGRTRIIIFTDKDTKQHIAYSPSLDLSGYGETEQKAIEMLKFNMGQFFEHLYHLPTTLAERELRALGWKRDRFFSKEFSKARVDVNGVLQDFNAQEGSVREITLQAA